MKKGQATILYFDYPNREQSTTSYSDNWLKIKKKDVLIISKIAFGQLSLKKPLCNEKISNW